MTLDEGIMFIVIYISLMYFTQLFIILNFKNLCLIRIVLVSISCASLFSGLHVFRPWRFVLSVSAW